MSLILIIDTSNETAFVSISRNGIVLSEQINTEQNKHAAFVHIAIQDACTAANISLQELDALAVVNGPGSYTGLRVGLSTAKGLCFTLHKPLILLNTLYMMGAAIRKQYLQNNTGVNEKVLYCPLIDARRMEVFTAIYDAELNEVLEPTAMIIDEFSFQQYYNDHQIVFGGNGTAKVENILPDGNATYYKKTNYIAEAAYYAEKSYENSKFENLIYSEPYYLKEFYTNTKI